MIPQSSSNISLTEVFDVNLTTFKDLFKLLKFSLTLRSDAWLLHLVNVSVKNLSLAFAGRLLGAVIIADWDEWASRIPAGVLRTKMWRVSEFSSFALADLFVVASRFLGAELIRQEGLKSVVYLPYGTTLIPSSKGIRPFLSEGVYVAYVGSFAPNYIGDMLEILKCGLVCKRMGYKLLLIGAGVLLPQLRIDLENQGVSVHYTDRLSPQAVDDLLLDPKIIAGFLPLERTRQNLSRCPNKIFHYIKASLPVITNRVGEAEGALGDRGCYYEHGSEEQLMSALTRAACGRIFYEMENYSWDTRFEALRPWLGKMAERVTVI
jgi:hypothetical protein